MIRPTAIIAEDEENLRINLRKMLQRLWPEINICGEAGDGEEAIDLINQKNPDIVFLDIKMPVISGLEVAQNVSKNQKIVFVTAYDQYAVKAFENEAIDYLLKPITEERLIKTISRLKRTTSFDSISSNFDDKIEKLIKTLKNKDSLEKLRLIKVNTGKGIQFLPVSHICFFKAEYKYTTVQTPQKEYIIKTPIIELESRLDTNHFWRVHRSAIVNIDKISKIIRSATNRMIITFADTEKTVKVSKSFEYLFKQM